MRRVAEWIGPVLVLVLLLAGTANAQGWTAFSPEGGRCKVDMPGTPTVETVPLNSPGQTLTMTEAKVQAGGATFFMSWVDYPERIALSASSDTMLDKVRDGMAAGSTLRGEKKLTLGRAQGREFTLAQANGTTTAVRLYWARNRLYQLGVTGRGGVENQPETRHFFEFLRARPDHRARSHVPKPMMHLAQFLVHGPTYHSVAMWRHPRTAAAGYDWTQPELYQHIARVCERGKLDMVFFADLNYISDTFTGSLAPAIRNATQAPEHDPLPLLSFMAAATTHIGLGATYSVSHQHPFHAARLWATLDHLTRGRAAWNVVTTLNHNQSANYGEEMKPTDERYDRAHEFMDVCRKLWASWDEDAVVMDRDAGIFADPDKVHRVDHEGRFFKSRGPLNVVRSPHHGDRPSCRPAPRARAATSPRDTPTRCSPSSPTSPAPRRCTTTSSAAWSKPAVRPRPARCCSACSRSSAPRAPRPRTSRPSTMPSSRWKAGSPSCPAISTSTCRPCRSTPSWPIAPNPSCSACRRAIAPPPASF